MMSNEHLYESSEASYGGDRFERIRPNADNRRRPPRGQRRGKAPQSVNGMHRRRRKKVAW